MAYSTWMKLFDSLRLQAHRVTGQGHCYWTDMLLQKTWRAGIRCIVRDPGDAASATRVFARGHLERRWTDMSASAACVLPSLNCLISESSE